MNSELNNESNAHLLSSGKEFRDTRMIAKYAMGGIAGLGLFGAVSLFRQAGQRLAHLLDRGRCGARRHAHCVGCHLLHYRPARAAAANSRWHPAALPVQNSKAFPIAIWLPSATKWTDVLRNGVYSYTQVRFGFSSHDPTVPVITYDATADFETLKYEQLEDFQDEVAAIVAGRMFDVMQREGRVEWTAKLAIRPDGLEITKKPGSRTGVDRLRASEPMEN